jgi:predicted permease
MNVMSSVEALWQDFVFTLRMLRKSPGFTAVTVLTLALGIGANTAIFSLIDSLLLKSLPVRDPQHLYVWKLNARERPSTHSSSSYGDCRIANGAGNYESCSFSHPFFNEMRARTDVFESLTGSAGSVQLAMTGEGPATNLRAGLVGGNYFDVLGVHPALGRLLQLSDESPSANAAIVLGYGFWQRQFGGSPDVVGKTVTMNNVPTTIVGVAEQKFLSLLPGSVSDAWVPITLRGRYQPRWAASPSNDGSGAVWIVMMGRLKPGLSLAQAQSAASLVFQNEALNGAHKLFKESAAPRIILMDAQSGLNGSRGQFEGSLFIMMLAVGIILVIACANVAGLLLSRSAVRQKEMALRLALGAGRWRIVRQLLTESLILSALGGALGIALAIWLARAIIALVASGSTGPSAFQASIDTRVLLFTMGVTLLTGILFGIAPALRGMRVDLTPALKEGTGASAAGGRPHNRWFNLGNSLVVTQVALTMVVLVGAGLLVRTLQNLRSIDPGFATNNLLNFSIDPTNAGYKGAQVDVVMRNLQEHIAAVPGILSVSYSGAVLLTGGSSTTDLSYINGVDKKGLETYYLPVGLGFFKTMKIPVLAGRDFTKADYDIADAVTDWEFTAYGSLGENVPPPPPAEPVLVNQEFVRKYLGNTEPLGAHTGYHSEKVRTDPGYVIVGVVGNTRYDSLRKDVPPTMYVPAAEGGANFEVRTAGNPDGFIAAVRNAVNDVDANLPLSRIQTEEQGIDQLLLRERLVARLSSLFGLLALVLACVGLYGLLSYEVARRTREIGIRMALGAPRAQVLRMVVGQGIVLALVGIAAGIGATIGVTRYLESVLFNVHARDPFTLSAVAITLIVVALVACFVPARRATQVDPMVALRNE